MSFPLHPHPQETSALHRQSSNVSMRPSVSPQSSRRYSDTNQVFSSTPSTPKASETSAARAEDGPASPSSHPPSSVKLPRSSSKLNRSSSVNGGALTMDAAQPPTIPEMLVNAGCSAYALLETIRTHGFLLEHNPFKF